MKRPRIGVVNWDAIYPADTYFGGYAFRSLANHEHKNRLPYFTKSNADGSFCFLNRSQQEYDDELKIAADAGIDYFMYCWYPEKNQSLNIGEEQDSFLKNRLAELNTARKLYQKSPLNRRIKMCAIIIAVHAYSKQDFNLLVDAMEQDYYEKKNGRPLVFFFGGYKTEYFASIREIAGKRGLDPYVIFINNGVESETGDYSKADAVSSYAACASKIETFEELTNRAEEANEDRKKYGIPIIPLLSAGWNPQPRIDNPVPWCSYPDDAYAPAPTADQMEAATLRLFDWMEKNKDYVDPEYCAIFAWNEFEEGGYLCPTLGEDGKPECEALAGLSRAIHSFE